VSEFNWKKLKRPFVGLSPMADYTDSPFSLLCRKFGADVIYREMVSAEAVCRKNEKTLRMASFSRGERPVILQIFGANPLRMAQAAAILEEKYRPDGIDINMGCPARKIISNFNGAFLMKDPALAARIVKEIKSAVSLSVSVKTRLGWEREIDILDFSRVLEEAGVDALAIHGRTKKQEYSGRANWDIIGRVKTQLKIPVILNGDIVDFASFGIAMKESGTDGALIGRAAIGNPWVFRSIKKKKDISPSVAEIKKIIFIHAKAHMKHYGERGMTSFRKHLLVYFKGISGAKGLRPYLASISSFAELKDALRKI
jgi:tRNA-dihydrouridine synthase B